MSATDNQLKASRTARDAAKARLDARLDTVREALDGQSVKDRVMHDAIARVQGVAEQSLDVARQSRWIIAATVAALLGWLFRRPAVAAGKKAAERLSGIVARGEPRFTMERLRRWTDRKAKR